MRLNVLKCFIVVHFEHCEYNVFELFFGCTYVLYIFPGNKLRASPTALKGNIDASKKTVDKDVSAEKSTPYIPREEKPCGRVDLASAKVLCMYYTCDLLHIN